MARALALALALEALALALRLLWLDKTNTAMDVVYFEASRTTRTKQKYLSVSSDQRALGALAFARALAPCEHIAVALPLALGELALALVLALHALAVAFVLAP